jgi:apolipoprotein D and lipocalin family protein
MAGWIGIVVVAGCATSRVPLPTAAHVDVSRYMGSWYVIASIPTFLEKGAYNAVETYARDADGTIAVTFTFHKGGFDGPLKTMKPRGFVLDATGAVWGMRFVWPIKADYRIAYLNDDYTEVIVGRSARDYVWIMARKPQLPADEYQRLVQRVAGMGYDLSKLQTVPQRWP